MNFRSAMLLLTFFGAFATDKSNNAPENSLLWGTTEETTPNSSAKKQEKLIDDLMNFDDKTEKESNKDQDVTTLKKLLFTEVRELFSGVGGDETQENHDVLTCEPEKKSEGTVLVQEDEQKAIIVNDQSQEKIQPALQIQNKQQVALPLQVNPKVLSAMIQIATNSCRAMSYGQKQYVRLQNFYSPQEIATLGLQSDPESIIKNLKVEEKKRKAWGADVTELIVEENRLGFRKRPKRGPEISMFWGPESSWIYNDDKESFPVGFTYKFKFYKIKSYELAIRAGACPIGQSPDHDDVFLSITYKTDSSHAITLYMLQKQPRAETQPNTRKVLFSNCNVKPVKEKVCEISLVAIRNENAFFQNIAITEFPNLLENSKKIKFQEIKKIWEDSITQKLEIVVAENVRQKRLALFLARLTPAIPALFLGNPGAAIALTIYLNLLAFLVKTAFNFVKNDNKSVLMSSLSSL